MQSVHNSSSWLLFPSNTSLLLQHRCFPQAALLHDKPALAWALHRLQFPSVSICLVQCRVLRGLQSANICSVVVLSMSCREIPAIPWCLQGLQGNFWSLMLVLQGWFLDHWRFFSSLSPHSFTEFYPEVPPASLMGSAVACGEATVEPASASSPGIFSQSTPPLHLHAKPCHLHPVYLLAWSVENITRT